MEPAIANVSAAVPVTLPAPTICAILRSSVNGTQVRILLVLATIGARTRTQAVRISRPALARETGMRDSGAFGAALSDLITRGVVTVLDRGRGRRLSTYSVKDAISHWMASSAPRKSALIARPQNPPER